MLCEHMTQKRGVPMAISLQKNILIVVDEPLDMRFLCDILKDDYTLFTASSGYDAITVAMNVVPDLILMNTNLSDLTGYEVLSALNCMNETKNLLVILLCSTDQLADKARAIEFHMMDEIIRRGNR